MHDPKAGVYGICLRGKPGWGDNMAFLTTMVNTYGGQWFDMSWKPQIDTKPWHDAITFYVDLMKKYGPPGASANSFNENLALFNEGKCGMWIDATIAASFISDPKQSKVADKVAFAQAPYGSHAQGRQLAVGLGAGDSRPARRRPTRRRSSSTGRPRRTTSSWSRKEDGWAAVPTGTRKSTYANARVPEGREVRRGREEGDRHRQPERQHAAEVARTSACSSRPFPSSRRSASRSASR